MDEPVSKTSLSDDGLHLLDYLIILAKHSRLIIFASAAVVVLTFLDFFMLPNSYTATTRLLPPQQNMTLSAQLLNNLGGGVTPGISGGMGAGGLGGMAAGLMGLKSAGDIYVGMMTGNTILDRMIERFKLRKLSGENYIESIRKTLANRTKIITGKEGLISVDVIDKDPKRAAEMANAFVEELDKLLQGLAVQEAGSRLAFLEKERAQTNQNLTKAEEALRTFSEQKNVIEINTQVKSALDYIAHLRAEIDSKEVQMQVVRQQATPFNYDVMRLETELKSLKEKLQNAEKQYDQTCIGDVCLDTSKVPTLGLEYSRLYREAKYQENLYQLYAKIVELARLDMARDVAIIQVVDRAMPPERRTNTRGPPALVAGMFACLITVIYAFLKENYENAQYNEDDQKRLSLLATYLQPYKSIVVRIQNRTGFKRQS